MIDIDGIKAFSTVADTKSFSLAAHRLHLTQPAVSKRIALLESQMGVRLFDRIGRTVNLTEAGRELEQRARDILLSIEDTQRVISNLAGNIGGSLSCDKPSYWSLASTADTENILPTLSGRCT